MLWHASGGSGDRTILLLHGLGATSAVWTGVQRLLDQRSLGRWIAPDLSGHGGSDPQPHYSVGQMACEIASLVQDEHEVFVLGHSLGVYVGLALASRWFGVGIRGVMGLGPKISWPESDLRTTRELAGRPVRWYATSDEAADRYRRVSGLESAIAPGEQWLLRGITQGERGWRLSQDPRTFGVAGAPFATLAAGAQARIALARGEHDPMVRGDELRVHATDTEEIPGAGHNAHVEKPEAIVQLLQRLVQHE